MSGDNWAVVLGLLVVVILVIAAAFSGDAASLGSSGCADLGCP